jgi:hypothetical protein
MVVTSQYLHPAIEPLRIETAKVFFLKTVFVCGFDLDFKYSLCGWEGSASDVRVYEEALTRGLIIPEGKYILGDLGYPYRGKLLVPYRGVRYHLAEWGRANVQ